MYSMDVFDAETRVWETVAMFPDFMPVNVIAYMGRALWDCVDGATDIAIIDMATGEVVWSHNNDTWQEEPAWIDNDCGFDPYLGCYTDDC